MVHVPPVFPGQMRAFPLPALLLAGLLSPLACKSKSESKPATVSPVAASASAPVRLPAPQRRRWTAPSGPVLAILPGKGVGPIRIGATVATIERLMAAKCDVKTPEVCRYLERAVEFWLEKGAAKTIHVHRAGRLGKDAQGQEVDYGFFHGAIPPDLQFGMIPRAIQEHLGPPQRVERSEALGAALNAEVHYYDGITLEYDRIENGNLVLGGAIIYKPAPVDASVPPATSAQP